MAETTKEVKMLDNDFDPPTVEIEVGDTVKWTNDGDNTHTATATDLDAGGQRLFDTGDVESGDSASHSFNDPSGQAGIAYECVHHDMSGVVIVKPVQKRPS